MCLSGLAWSRGRCLRWPREVTTHANSCVLLNTVTIRTHRLRCQWGLRLYVNKFCKDAKTNCKLQRHQWATPSHWVTLPFITMNKHTVVYFESILHSPSCTMLLNIVPQNILFTTVSVVSEWHSIFKKWNCTFLRDSHLQSEQIGSGLTECLRQFWKVRKYCKKD